MILSQYPTYFNGQDANKQIAVMRTYIQTLKDEIEDSLNDIHYDQLTPALRAKFDAIDTALAGLQRMITTTEENITVNYSSDIEIDKVYAKITTVDNINSRLEAVEADYVTDSELSGVADRVTTLENDVGALEDINADSRLTALEAIDANTRLEALEEFEPKAVTTDNTETIIADKSLKVASIKIGNNTYTEQTVTIGGQTINFLGY